MDYQRRDEVLRAYFLGKDWDRNPEFGRKRAVVTEGLPDLAEFPFLIEDEWELSPGHTNEGRGDLVFADGAGRFAVVEVKDINFERSGRTARSKRTSSRKLVKEQALRYAEAYCKRQSGAVEVVAFTLTPTGITRLASFRKQGAYIIKERFSPCSGEDCFPPGS